MIYKIKGWFKERKRKEIVKRLGVVVYKVDGFTGQLLRQLGLCYNDIWIDYWRIGCNVRFNLQIPVDKEELDVNLLILGTCVDFLDGEDG